MFNVFTHLATQSVTHYLSDSPYIYTDGNKVLVFNIEKVIIFGYVYVSYWGPTLIFNPQILLW